MQILLDYNNTTLTSRLCSTIAYKEAPVYWLAANAPFFTFLIHGQWTYNFIRCRYSPVTAC